LEKYRKAINKHARLVVLHMVPTGKMIEDPKDPQSLDIVGLDANFYDMTIAFAKGEF
jgi:hypothetical protein